MNEKIDQFHTMFMVKHEDPVMNYGANSISLHLKLKKYKEL